MKTQRRQNDSEDGQTISRRRKTRSSTSKNRREYSDPIPIDLIIEILSRLPLKSIARFHCVSKLWDSLLRRPDRYCKTGGLICGLVSQTVKGREETVPMLCNLSTGQSLALPKVKTRRVGVKIFLGYDPIDKLFKLLAMTSRLAYYGRDEISDEHQVMTLGTKKQSWRMIKCDVPHYPRNNGIGIFINGSLYYLGIVKNGEFLRVKIVCFDVRSEKFMLINRDEDMSIWSCPTLINYKGRLGALLTDWFDVTGESSCLELWVLVDAKKHEWSKHIYELPSLWKNLVGDARLYFVGMTGSNEIILSPHYMSYPHHYFYVFYYNMERKTVTKGMGEFQHGRVDISLDHVEDLKLMQLFRTL